MERSAVTDAPPRQIGTCMSAVLVLGLCDKNGAIALLAPDTPVLNRARMRQARSSAARTNWLANFTL